MQIGKQRRRRREFERARADVVRRGGIRIFSNDGELGDAGAGRRLGGRPEVASLACETVIIGETMKIYTKTGDQGETGLFGGPRVRKDHPRIAAYGEIDELNAVLGLVRAEAPPRIWMDCWRKYRICYST